MICLGWFVVIRPIMSRRSINLPILFPEQDWLTRRRRMNVENISWSISTKVWERTGIKLTTPGSAITLATDCASWPGGFIIRLLWIVRGVYSLSPNVATFFRWYKSHQTSDSSWAIVHVLCLQWKLIKPLWNKSRKDYSTFTFWQ